MRRAFSPDGSKMALLFIEGMPRVAGPLQPMTPLSGVIGDKIYEQRLATIDLGTNALKQLTPADMYVYEYDWTPDGKAGSRPPRTWFRRRELVRGAALPHRFALGRNARDLRSEVADRRSHASRPMERTSRSSKA